MREVSISFNTNLQTARAFKVPSLSVLRSPLVASRTRARAHRQRQPTERAYGKREPTRELSERVTFKTDTQNRRRMSRGGYRQRESLGNDADAWDDSALIRAYDAAISRHGGTAGPAPASRGHPGASSPASSTPSRGAPREREAVASPRGRESDDVGPSAGVRAAEMWLREAQYSPRSFEPPRHRAPAPQPYYYVEDEYYEAEAYGADAWSGHRNHRPPPPPHHLHHPPRSPHHPPPYHRGGYDPYDAYGAMEHEFAGFSPFGGRRRPSPRRGGAPPMRGGPPRAPPDMTESALETARSYADDGHDPDELANLLLAWYYAGYYTGSYSKQPEHRETF